MNNKPICFVISPIGEVGTTTRQDADDLLELIIKPVLDLFGFETIRGDHRSEANQIDVDVIKSVQSAELCIADISQPNPNVYYEVGRRDETGKPMILLKSKSSDLLPVDIATRRYIEYDLDSRRGLGDARHQLQNFIEPLVKSGFEGNGAGTSLSDLAAVLQRVERKLDRMANAAPASATTASVISTLPEGTDPKEAFQLARKQNNIALMDQALDMLRLSIDKWKFLDYYVEIAAGKGSQKAAAILFESASEFMDQSFITFHQKVEYIATMVTVCGQNDTELRNLEVMDGLFNRLEALCEGADAIDITTIFNQRNRLYYGIFLSTKDPNWLKKSIENLEIALHYTPNESFLWHNLSLCYQNLEGHMEDAVRCIDRSLELDGDKVDEGHLQTAYRIYRAVDDPRKSDVLECLRAVNPVKAALLESQ
ncbi:MAG: hypothetical protein E7618_05530 [Ruminococcaceae bacterium]|nr:hypothetical protein [Oscillospiraceae bacterium]